MNKGLGDYSMIQGFIPSHFHNKSCQTVIRVEWSKYSLKMLQFINQGHQMQGQVETRSALRDLSFEAEQLPACFLVRPVTPHSLL